MSWSKPISEWARATFGAATPQRALDRTDDEFCELLEAQSAEEAADVVICLCGFAAAEGFDLAAAEAEAAHWTIRLAAEPVAAFKAIDTAFEMLLEDPHPINAGLVVGALRNWCEVSGFDLNAAVEAKMAINRQRKWKLSGDGTGQHE